MGHRYEEAVQVQVQEVGPQGAVAGAEGPRPSAFLWRGRLYAVREVLGHWYDRAPWWEGVAVAALHGEALPPSAQPAAGPGPAEREVWRVAASAGRSAGTGTYDLTSTPSPVPRGPAPRRSPEASPQWCLVRVVD